MKVKVLVDCKIENECLCELLDCGEFLITKDNGEVKECFWNKNDHEFAVVGEGYAVRYGDIYKVRQIVEVEL